MKSPEAVFASESVSAHQVEATVDISYEIARPPVASVSDFAVRTEVDAALRPVGRLGSWHLPPGQTLPGLCRVLEDRGVSYAVIPPAVRQAPGKEGHALLVDDAHISRVRDLLTLVPLGHPLAVYSTTGLPGFSYQQHWRSFSPAVDMAILPPYLAEAMLARTRLDERGVRVPQPQEMLLWLIYRALYLLGDRHFAPALPQGASPILAGPCAEAIEGLAVQMGAGLASPLTLDALDRYLSSAGWEPPHDVLRRLSLWNSWADYKLRHLEMHAAPEAPGMTAFFVRRATLASGMYADIASMLEFCGFELLKVIDLGESQIAAASRATRGGNWGAGEFPTSGGPPARILIAFDALPTPVDDDVRRRHPCLDNGRIYDAKQRCRRLVNDRMPPNRRFNGLHSTDNSLEAWGIVEQFAPDEVRALRAIVESRRAELVSDFEVVRDLSRYGFRAKVELVRYAGGLAVKKTFRHQCLHYLERETRFLETVSPHRQEILPVLEKGSNYFITPYVETQPARRVLFGSSFPKLMTLRQVRDVADLFNFLFARGYDPVDLTPHNLLIDKSGTVKAIDFEFVHCWERQIEPERSACLGGVRAGFEGEWPPINAWCLADPYHGYWYGYTGLKRRSFFNDPPWLQSVKRMINYPTYLGGKALRRLPPSLRGKAKEDLKRRLPLLCRMAGNVRRARTA